VLRLASALGHVEEEALAASRGDLYKAQRAALVAQVNAFTVKRERVVMSEYALHHLSAALHIFHNHCCSCCRALGGFSGWSWRGRLVVGHSPSPSFLYTFSILTLFFLLIHFHSLLYLYRFRSPEYIPLLFSDIYTSPQLLSLISHYTFQQVMGPCYI
jgi:hypothetical protein